MLFLFVTGLPFAWDHVYSAWILVLALAAALCAAAVLLGYWLGKREEPQAVPAPVVTPSGTKPELQRLDQFLGMVSHEWRTPLTAILGYSEMLQEDAEQRELPDMVADLRRVQNAGQHMLGLLDDVVDLFRLQAGTLEVVVQPFDAARLVEEVVRQGQAVLQTAPHTLEVVIPPDLPTLQTDRVKLRRALANVLRFCCGLAGKDPLRIEVTTEKDDRGQIWVRFAVSNPGARPDPMLVDSLVTMLARSRQLTPMEMRGPGLGLAATVELCRLMGGALDVRFDEGKGAMLAVRVPVAAPGAKA